MSPFCFAVNSSLRTQNIAGVSRGQDRASPCVSVSQEAKAELTTLTLTAGSAADPQPCNPCLGSVTCRRHRV